MLLVVDCSSASGCSKGLTLLLLGRKNEEKPMRVAPWTQYHLVDQESDPDLQLAPRKNGLVRGRACFVCFGRAAAGLESPSHLKVGPTQQPQPQPQPRPHDDLKRSADSEKVNKIRASDLVDHDNLNSTNAGSLRSSLKRPTASVLASVAVNEGECEQEPGDTERRKVQWTDVFGGEVFEIREFEPSEHGGSDDEFENGNRKTCSCRIM